MDAIWADQPPVPQRPVRVHPVKFAGVAVPEKLAAVRKLVIKERASSLVVMAMDEVSPRCCAVYHLEGGMVVVMDEAQKRSNKAIYLPVSSGGTSSRGGLPN